MIFNIHGGHSLVARGAASLIDEVVEDRKVKNRVIELLKKEGHTVYDCTDDTGTTQAENLANIVKKCNAHKVDLDVSIHFNACVNDLQGNGKTTGTEVHIYSENGGALSYAQRIVNNISNALGLKNRGIWTSPQLYVLKNTNSPALLIECCFVDDKDDVDRWNVEKCAVAIVEGILNKKIDTTPVKVNQLFFRGFSQSKGWLPVQQSGGIAGMTGQALRLEALKIDYKKHDVYAKAHIQGKGWVDYGKINSDTVIGTTGQSKRLECLCLKGDLEWRAYLQSYGWTAWTKADGVCTLGTVGKGIRIEAVQLKEL